jgi:hypothetical protein
MITGSTRATKPSQLGQALASFKLDRISPFAVVSPGFSAWASSMAGSPGPYFLTHALNQTNATSTYSIAKYRAKTYAPTTISIGNRLIAFIQYLDNDEYRCIPRRKTLSWNHAASRSVAMGRKWGTANWTIPLSGLNPSTVWSIGSRPAMTWRVMSY